MINLTSFTRPEHIGDIPFTPNTRATLQTRNGILPSDMFYAAIILEVELRLAVGVADATSERADSPFNLINLVEISGIHRIRKANEVFFSRRGPDIYHSAQLFGGRAPGTTFNGNVLVAQGNKDIRFYLPIWFVPEGIAFPQQIGYLLDARNYDNLVMTIHFGDGTSLYDPAATTTFTFTAFGSAAGTGRVRVHAVYAPFKNGQAPMNFVPARLFKYNVAELTGSLMTTTAVDQRLFNIPRGNGIRSLLFKTGTIVGTDLTPGLSAYDTYAPATTAVTEPVSNVRIMQGFNKQIRQFISYNTLREYGAMRSRINSPNGYGLLDFCEQGDLRTFLDTARLIAGAAGDSDLYVQGNVLGAANQAALLMIDEIRGRPNGL